ncbi:hypothetical protein JAAARDRAFT_37446 [Jaapia argillacea MUCL 33604]|uniref:Cytochrome P450 n=1 Tax=Jaapia argillacea MUCL 33604 TaxID=933084 RepID=A0A067PKP0_9AGAM|nr:hypothetical protein JAAARDRAFT_37446 [Jaapia argillacea MUCL 33604]
MFTYAPYLFGLVVSICCFLYTRHRQDVRRRFGLPYPPGPKPLPIIGNLCDLPKENESATYFQWAQRYGDLVYANVLGRDLLFVNSAQVAADLFEKRFSNYSDRTPLYMINDLMGWEWSFGMMRYGDRWKKHRLVFDRQFKSSVAPAYRPIQAAQCHLFLRRLLDSPNDLLEHLRHNAASTIMKVIYGIDIEPQNDHYVEVAEEALTALGKAATPGAFLVDSLPFLKYVPEWMPGAGFKRKARLWKKTLYEMRDAPFEAVKVAMIRGGASPSFVSNLLGDLNPKADSDEQMETIKCCAGLGYAAGAESVVSALSSFFLAMILCPEVQRKAQSELDVVIGPGSARLPHFNDRSSTPYINAIVKEVLRWNPVAPLGLPHMTTKDDVYNGYFIPSGTTVFGNTWTILHDESVYPQPLMFSPERFLSPDGRELNKCTPDPLAAFGYGRRICPGRHMAEATLWISIASILATFDVGPGLDDGGRPVKTKAEFSSGAICHPLPFQYTISPRSDIARRLIQQTADVAP